MAGYGIEFDNRFIGARTLNKGEVIIADIYTESFPPRSPIEDYIKNPISGSYPHRQAGYTVHGLLGAGDQLWFLYIMGDPDMTAGHLKVARDLRRPRGLSVAGYFEERNRIIIPDERIGKYGVKLLLSNKEEQFTGKLLLGR